MPVLVDFSVARYEDGVLSISLSPATAIGGWDIVFTAQHRFGGLSGFIRKSTASGFTGVSGITVVNSGAGIFSVALRSQDTSGIEYGNYAYTAERRDSGNRTILTEGYMMVTPGVG